jgi:hypothetical protein
LRILLVFELSGDARERQRRAANRRMLQARLRKALRRQGLGDRYTLKVIASPHVDRDEVLRYYRRMKTGPSEALLFYANTHGLTDPARGHYLRLGGQRLFRSELRAAMLARNPRLAVILTDVCADMTFEKLPHSRPVARRRKPARPGRGRGVLRDLFFRQTGLVDVNAAKRGFSAWGSSRRGNHFTRALVRLLAHPAKRFDRDGDGRVDWREFYDVLSRETLRSAAQRGKRQPPQAFALGKRSRTATWR